MYKLAYMGDSETSIVYAAELQGIRLALQITDEDAVRGARCILQVRCGLLISGPDFLT
jgi:hypothetical protein